MVTGRIEPRINKTPEGVNAGCETFLNVQINGSADVNNQYSITNRSCLLIKGDNVRIKAPV